MSNVIKKIGKKYLEGAYRFAVRYKGVFTAMYMVFVLAMFSDVASAADIMTRAQSLLNDARSKILGFSTAAAVVGVGTGVFMKKFSMGKQDKMEMGSKIMKDTIVGWGVLNGTPYILEYLAKFVGSK